ncbi:MAG: Asp-tRNA(Asn)/Glu-tRNA(Gln) amidotransferase subunit GatC [Candidatus Portnoybacteria bacterium]|nr:Asp-tRNA(Asn)/Glu-tRNA(Gln) amidotransferase subunit GatC [Candidatus Portnoybacteria bacterium]
MIDVKKIAQLARLGLGEGEEEKFKKELSSILDFVEELKKVPTDNVESTDHVTGLLNVVRKDEYNFLSQDDEVKEAILANAPQKQGRFFKVKRILE